jgi:NADPH-dependent glutamate synthase beta subunit-like oxidoreductase
MKYSSSNAIPLFIPHSNISTEANKTGSWRFFYPKYEEKTAPCSAACPLGQDIARIEMLTSAGYLQEAWRTILVENPFPAICGRVCFHPCEKVCNRQNLDQPIAIHKLERFLADTAIKEKKATDFTIKPPNGKKVAIAGAGPAGLAAAFFLKRLGYDCDVFEARSEPGGLLRWGIPAYRLPRDILQHEIKRIENVGVNIHCHVPVTKSLMQKIGVEYDALFVGTGYGRPISLNIEGGHLAHNGLAFLSKLQQGKGRPLRGAAAIIGGGNTAVDVSRALARLGSSPSIVYRRRREDMPAFAPEVAMALEEGVRIMELVAPIHIREQFDDSSSSSDYVLTLQEMKIAKKEIGGRARVIPDGQKTRTMTVQNIFVAIGAEADALWHFPKADESEMLELSHCKVIDCRWPIILGGDLASPIKSVADAIASGKQAALVLDIFSNNGKDAVSEEIKVCQVGDGPALSMAVYLGEDRKNNSAHIVSADEIVTDHFQPIPRTIPASLNPRQSIQSFAEVESMLSNEAAGQEAARCFNCGICNSCDYCRLYCPEMAVVVKRSERWINMDYCKGCGVCVTECPRNAMALEDELN